MSDRVPAQIPGRKRLHNLLPRRRAKLALVLLALAVAVFVFAPWVRTAWQLRAARQALSTADPRAALELLEKTERVRPNNAELHFLLAKAHRRAGHLTPAAASLKEAERLGWDEEDIQREQNLMLMQMGRLQETEAWFRRVSRHADDQLAEELYEARAQGLLHTYRLHDALVCLNFWLRWKPDAVQARCWRGELWERVQHWDDACHDYRAALNRAPGHRLARERLASCLLTLNKTEEALQEYETLLRADPDHPEALIGAAKCLRALSKPAAAETALQRALKEELPPQQESAAVVELASIALDRKKVTEAIGLLETAVKKDPLNSRAHYALSMAYTRGGRSEQAAESIERAAELDRISNRHAEIARELVAQPDRPDLRWEAGKLLMDQGLKQQGAAWILTALHYDPAHRPSHEALSEYYTDAGNSRLAEHHRRLARQAIRSRRPGEAHAH